MTAPKFDAAGPGTRARVWSRHLDPTQRQALSLDGVRRVVVVGAHPDDESLGAGGLIATSRKLGISVDLVCATEGAGSHPDSPTHTPEEMARRRSQEWAAAAALLGVDKVHRHRLGLPDGDLSAHVESVTSDLVDLIGDGRDTVLVAPWREDGHPDHAAVGYAAAAAARRTDAELWEHPIWFWHWGLPDDPRTNLLRPLPLSPAAQLTKRGAIGAHRSQVARLSALAGDEALLSTDMLAHFERALEWYVVTPGDGCPDETLDRLHRRSGDPWGVDTRWYERRKRDLLLAVLPRQKFRRAFEIGCSTGALTESLAARADELLAVDNSATALAAARRRLAGQDGVAISELDVPSSWPEGTFDLVVISEVGYFLSPRGLEDVVHRVASCLTPDGVVMLCHWRHPVAGWALDASQVHRRFEEGLGPPQAVYRDRDVEIRAHADAWLTYDE